MIDIGLHDNIIITNPVDEAIQELDILFNTTPTELIGNTSYGVNFLQFLWQLTPETERIEQYIRDRITMMTYYMKFLKFDLSVSIVDDINEFMYVINITIYDENEIAKEKTYILKN